MRTFISGLLVLGTLVVAVDAAAQCSKDTDCKGDRICTRGVCVVAAPVVAPPPSPPPLRFDYERAPRNVILTNPLSLINGSIGVEYERVLARWFSLAVSVSFYGSMTDVFHSSDDLTMLGAMFTVQPRFYLLRRGAPRGLYLSPVASVAYLTASQTDLFGYYDDTSLSGVGFTAGGLVGWSWIIGRHFNVKFSAGVQYRRLTLSDDFGTTTGVSGVAPLGELTFGWAF